MRRSLSPFAAFASLFILAGTGVAFAAKARLAATLRSFIINCINYCQQNFDNAKTVSLVAVSDCAAGSLYRRIKSSAANSAGTNFVCSVVFSGHTTITKYGVALPAKD